MTLSFRTLFPFLASSSSVSSISAVTRSPPNSMPSYVKLPELRLATKMCRRSSGYFSRREVAR